VQVRSCKKARPRPSGEARAGRDGCLLHLHPTKEPAQRERRSLVQRGRARAGEILAPIFMGKKYSRRAYERIEYWGERQSRGKRVKFISSGLKIVRGALGKGTKKENGGAADFRIRGMCIGGLNKGQRKRKFMVNQKSRNEQRERTSRPAVQRSP